MPPLPWRRYSLALVRLLLLNEVLHVQIVLVKADLRHALIPVLGGDLLQLLLEHAPQKALVGEKLLEIVDPLLQLLVLILQLLPVQALEAAQLHLQNGLGLHVVQGEPAHQVLLCVVVAGADDADDLVNVVLGDEQPLQQVGPLLGLAQVIAGPAEQDLLLVLEILVNDVAQGENLGLGLVVHQGQHVDGKGGLQLGLGIEPVEHHLGVGVPLELNDNAHSVPVRLVPDVGDALQPLVLHLVRHVLDEHPLVDLVGDLRDHNAGPVLAELLELRPGPDPDVAPAGGVGLADARPAHDDAPGWEVGTLDVLHQVIEIRLRVVQHVDAGPDHLPQVVGRDVGGHAHGDAGGAVDQQVGEPAGQDPGLLPGLVKVGVPVHGVLVNIPEHLVREL